MKLLLRLALIIAVFGTVYAAGFLFFVATLPQPDPGMPHADGIVALTGGDGRLDAVISLLERHAGQRLLITGVFQTTSREELARRFHGGGRFACCADIDYAAEDTHDNAEDAADWARRHRFRSLVVVTAQYHMPRSLAEFSAAMPHVRLVPYAVEPAGVDLARWWARPGTLHLLHDEYAKYLAALVTTRFQGKESAPSSGRNGDTSRAGLAS